MFDQRWRLGRIRALPLFLSHSTYLFHQYWSLRGKINGRVSALTSGWPSFPILRERTKEKERQIDGLWLFSRYFRASAVPAYVGVCVCVWLANKRLISVLGGRVWTSMFSRMVESKEFVLWECILMIMMVLVTFIK